MTTETLKIEVSWPETQEIPDGSTIELQLWAGDENASYSMIDVEICKPAVTSPVTFEVPVNVQELQIEDGTSSWDYFHTSPRLVQGGLIKNIAYAEKISVAEALASGWKMSLR
ncbi:hypothetical protein SE916_18460 [Pseudomonas sp. 5FOS]|uniref:hypothetical protein n=1 Tax=unclassified Pseudomonas TaxID=196821 RepID=UPI001F333D36|nr:MULTISPECIES: hypothetical protein [unclassified Pseudomonas]MCE5985890.1 hypothetical protein [Pseudomonas sp. LM20]MCE5994749.1 hypothetical protein [Pseudomonas sp. KCA11]UMY60618.1 hypothetical protein MKK04_20765 [Pseudomonas sp. LS.1a]